MAFLVVFCGVSFFFCCFGRVRVFSGGFVSGVLCCFLYFVAFWVALGCVVLFYGVLLVFVACCGVSWCFLVLWGVCGVSGVFRGVLGYAGVCCTVLCCFVVSCWYLVAFGGIFLAFCHGSGCFRAFCGVLGFLVWFGLSRVFCGVWCVFGHVGVHCFLVLFWAGCWCFLGVLWYIVAFSGIFMGG